MTPHAETVQSIKQLLAPPPRLKVSEWADAEAFIPDDGNAEPGKYRTSRMPWQAAMLDDVIDPTVQETFWMMCSQYAGKTMCGMLITEHRIKVLRSSTIVVYSTLKSAKRWMVRKFVKVVGATPCMKGLLGDPRKRDSESTALEREFPGGALTALGANSTSDFRGTTADGVLQDEIDDYEDGDEGDPCALADRACETFSNPTKLKMSTPKLAGFSRIAAGYESGDKQKYFVPCPCCGHMQHLITERMKFSFSDEEHLRFPCNVSDHKWSIGQYQSIDTEKTIYVCESCERGWTDDQRIAAIMSGHPDNPPVSIFHTIKDQYGFDATTCQSDYRAEWRATAPFTGIRSRHLNGMYAVIGLKQSFRNYLHMFAEKFLKAKRGGRSKFQVWVNTFKTEPFEDEAEKVDWKDLKERAEELPPDALPDQAMVIIGAMDIQVDRVEILSVGWGDEQECWILEYEQIYGDFDMPAFQDRVSEHLTKKRFKHRILGELAYKMFAVDSGHQTKVKAVFKFCRKHVLNNFVAVKGFDSILGALYSVRKERAHRINVFNLGTDMLKSTIFSNLKLADAGPNYIHLPKGKKFDDAFFQSICSEKRIGKKLQNGSTVYQWHKLTSSKRNEVLDMLVYAFGMYEVMRRDGGVEAIARQWREVLVKLKELEPQQPSGPKEYVMNPATEAKIPDLKIEHGQKKQFNRRPVNRRGGKGGGGLWNPLGLALTFCFLRLF